MRQADRILVFDSVSADSLGEAAVVADVLGLNYVSSGLLPENCQIADDFLEAFEEQPNGENAIYYNRVSAD